MVTFRVSSYKYNGISTLNVQLGTLHYRWVTEVAEKHA